MTVLCSFSAVTTAAFNAARNVASSEITFAYKSKCELTGGKRDKSSILTCKSLDIANAFTQAHAYYELSVHFSNDIVGDAPGIVFHGIVRIRELP